LEKKIIFGNESKVENETIFLSNRDFQSPRLSDKTSELANREINKMQNLTFKSISILELFSYKDTPLWYFFHHQLHLKLEDTLAFITNFYECVEAEKPQLIQIKNDFSRLDIINHICNEKKIKLKFSKLDYFLFKIRKVIISKLKKKIIIYLTKKKIKNRRNLFYQKKDNLPNINNRILFPAGPAFRRGIINILEGSTEQGEYFIQNIIDLIDDKNKIVGIDLITKIDSDDIILKERLSSKMTWFPIEVLFKNKNKSRKKQFLDKYQKTISSKEFQNLFQFNAVPLWPSLKETFEKMNFSPYIPYWIDIIDSLTSLFENEKPKAVMLLYDTGPVSLSLIVICKKFNIRTVGIQHGFIHKFHKDYSHDRFATEKDPFGFPLSDKLFLYGELTKKILLSKGYPSDKLVIFGNPVFFNLKKIENILENQSLFKKYNIDEKKKIILLASSGLQERHYNTLKHNYDVQIWQYLLENFGNNENYYLILKPHPTENSLTYEKILEKFNCTNAKIIQGNIFELIFISSLIVSIFSTIMFDSMCLKKPVIKVKFEDSYSSLLDEFTNVVFSSDLASLSRNIQKVLTNSEIRNNLLRVSAEFTKNSYNIPEENPRDILKDVFE